MLLYNKSCVINFNVEFLSLKFFVKIIIRRNYRNNPLNLFNWEKYFRTLKTSINSMDFLDTDILKALTEVTYLTFLRLFEDFKHWQRPSFTLLLNFRNQLSLIELSAFNDFVQPNKNILLDCYFWNFSNFK